MNLLRFGDRSAADILDSMDQVLDEALGLGFGTQGAAPGKFDDYPGDPRMTGTALAVTHTHPA